MLRSRATGADARQRQSPTPIAHGRRRSARGCDGRGPAPDRPGSPRDRASRGPLDWLDARAAGRAGGRPSPTRASVRRPSSGTGRRTPGTVRRTRRPGDATAVFAANDQMALGVIHGLDGRGIRVPEDVSVVGFDDVPDARHFLPPLTTVRQDFHRLRHAQCSTLLARLQVGDRAPTHGSRAGTDRPGIHRSTARIAVAACGRSRQGS